MTNLFIDRRSAEDLVDFWNNYVINMHLVNENTARSLGAASKAVLSVEDDWEKLDITEEKVRLKTHLDYFLNTMKEPGCGRKLNFISQEIGREINTIGSKANDATVQKIVVQMKDELEKIKEQLLNVL